MCLAIAASVNTLIPSEHLRNGWLGNNDGAGISFISPSTNKVVVIKGLMDMQSLLDTYHANFEVAGKTSPFLVHLRTSTHGSVTAGNTHPFSGEYGSFIHNGIFDDIGDPNRSDTLVFSELIRELPEEVLPEFLEEFEKLDVQGWSRLAFLGNSGKLYFMRESDGIWDKGIWYSNLGYCTGRRDRGGITDYGH